MLLCTGWVTACASYAATIKTLPNEEACANFYQDGNFLSLLFPNVCTDDDALSKCTCRVKAALIQPVHFLISVLHVLLFRLASKQKPVLHNAWWKGELP